MRPTWTYRKFQNCLLQNNAFAASVSPTWPCRALPFPMSTARPSLRLFLSEMARSPLLIGAIWPSSPALGRVMANWLPEDCEAPVLELGPGTGIVTAELLAAGLSEDRLVAVEKSEVLASYLSARYPRSRIVTGDALELDSHFAGEKFGAVISSLPLKVFGPGQVDMLSRQISEILLPGAPWVQFSYHIANGKPPAKSFRSVDSRIVWSNFPPAKVSVYHTQSAEAKSGTVIPHPLSCTEVEFGGTA